MSWFRRLFGRGQAEPERERTFEEVEEQAEQSLSEQYSEQRDDALSDALSALDDEEEQSAEVGPEKVPVEFHVEEAEADDLLIEEPLEDHYGMATGDAVDLQTADSHLASAASTGEDMSAYEQVDVPVLDDEFEVGSEDD
jgi:hypothetical protein